MGNGLIAFLGVPLQIIVAFLVALLLNLKVKGQSVFRTFFFIPGLCSSVAIALVWKWFYNKEFGLLNNMLGAFGINQVNWLGDKSTVMISMIIQAIWLGIGGGMVMYLAALKGVPRHLFEAAEVEGANAWHKLWRITVPLTTPTTFYLFIMGGMGALQDFARYQLMTNGNPNNASLMPVLYIYQSAFQYSELGYSFAAAMSWLLGLLIILFMGANFMFAKRWVHYD
jgi:multiple sugar transport system permease protein